MTGSGHLLVPTDFSPCSRRALEYALVVGRRTSSKIHLLHVVTPIETDPYGPIHHLPEVDATQGGVEQLIHHLLVEEARSLGSDETEVEPVEVHAGSAALGILDYADEIEASLIVMGTHGRQGIRHFLMGSVAEECVRRSTCSVLTIRADSLTEPSETRIQRILVPVDFSDYTLPLVKEARATALSYGAELDLLYVVEPLPFPLAFSGVLTLSDLAPSIRTSALGHLAKLSEEADLAAVPHRLHVVDGHAADSIVEFAEEHPIDLIMIATEPRTSGERFLIGSVTERVIRASPRPVYVMKLERRASGEAA